MSVGFFFSHWHTVFLSYTHIKNWFSSCYSTVISLLSALTAADTTEAHIRASCEEILPCCQSKVELRFFLTAPAGKSYRSPVWRQLPDSRSNTKLPLVWHSSHFKSYTLSDVKALRNTFTRTEETRTTTPPPQCHTHTDPAEKKKWSWQGKAVAEILPPRPSTHIIDCTS